MYVLNGCLTADRSFTTKYFQKTLIEVDSSHLYGSFGTFYIQIGQLFGSHTVDDLGFIFDLSRSSHNKQKQIWLEIYFHFYATNNQTPCTISIKIWYKWLTQLVDLSLLPKIFEVYGSFSLFGFHSFVSGTMRQMSSLRQIHAWDRYFKLIFYILSVAMFFLH